MEVVEGDEPQRDYIPLILHTMAAQDTAQRRLAILTGISKSRLGLLLHSDPDKRSVMTQPELEKILHALGTNVLQAYICIETFKGFEPLDKDRYATVISMLCEMFVGLPRKIIEALDDINGIDGSEVKRDWGGPLQKAVVKRVAEEVIKIRERRARLTDGDDFQI
ncbi:XRE family transcriptional regulator [Novosphingobium album (ex Liu et al. 2023)]|uniref:XRE family transcriptional regulator n=1 Tax=Novosphingobium album (ex Liu et al. 2023) TaxID=3031130 RepID=A0ABT5WTD6_9SPHN|nr:XRE family transcriptional regulator [Novosphingobium album (ex Liu et al. 2023)]MDE8652843.1 XRE family transcriptional regulator [Novosphingobium album (ex Liu et al. 2023)]